ncbi:MAG TPA: excinuclease ABC subunit A, partial [Aquificaceae bacterium]|nr:excinuclease ABC subunit A [Aquificaceae bacterium]
EYQQIKNELYKIQPKYKLYITEMLVFFLAIWTIEV